jgi:putative acetyltransferase
MPAGKVMEVVTIRQERSGDEEGIRLVNSRAFGQPAEAGIVDTLRSTCPEGVSFVAEREGQVVGHILFTPAVIEAQNRKVWGMGLAPVSVLPELQRQGIGSELVRAGLDEMRKMRQPFVIVLGHPEYYPRFGFVRASSYGIHSQWDGVPDEAFMILVLDEAALRGVQGVGKYRAEFDAGM